MEGLPLLSFNTLERPFSLMRPAGALEGKADNKRIMAGKP